MKHRGKIAALICALLMCMADGAQAQSWLGRLAVVDNPDPRDRLNLRTAPSENAPSIAKYYSGAVVSPRAEPENGWVLVADSALEGYMKAEFLNPADGDSRITPGIPLVTLTGDESILIYKEPDFASGAWGAADCGARAHVMAVMPGWCEVRLRDIGGYVPLENIAPRLSFEETDANVERIGEIPAYARGERIAIVHNPSPEGRLHLRKNPGTDAPSLGKYYSGTVAVVLSGTDGEWVKVRIGSLTGYMKREHLFVDELMWGFGDMLVPPELEVSNRTGLHLREGQSRHSRSLGLYPQGTKVQVLGLSTAWCHVLLDGQDGFMMLDKLTPRLAF